jgi:hypothetical protein
MKKKCLPTLFNPIVYQIKEEEFIGGSEEKISDNFSKIEKAIFSSNSIGAIKYSLETSDHDGWVLANEGKCVPKNVFPQLARIEDSIIRSYDSTHYFIPPVKVIEGILCKTQTLTSYAIEEELINPTGQGLKINPVRLQGYKVGANTTSKGIPCKINYKFYDRPTNTAAIKPINKEYKDETNTGLFSQNNLFGPIQGNCIIAWDQWPKEYREPRRTRNKNYFKPSYIEIVFDSPVPANTLFFAIDNVAGWKNMKLEVDGGTADVQDFNIIDFFGTPDYSNPALEKLAKNKKPVIENSTDPSIWFDRATGNFNLPVNWKNSRGSIISSSSTKTLTKLKFSADQDIRDTVVFTIGEAFPNEITQKVTKKIISNEPEKTALNGFVYIGPPNPVFVEPISGCPQLFNPDNYPLYTKNTLLSTTNYPYNNVYFSSDDGATPISWDATGKYYTDFLFETDYNHVVKLYGIDAVREFMQRRFPFSTLNEDDGSWDGPSQDPYIKVRLTEPLSFRISAVSGVPVHLPLIARGRYEFTEGVVDWGDNTSSALSADINPSHVYNFTGDVMAEFRGTLREIGWMDDVPIPSRQSIKELVTWGTSEISAISFAGTNSLTGIAVDMPEDVVNFNNIFKDCSSVPLNIAQRDTSNIRTMDGAFSNYFGTSAPNISAWDVSNVTSMIDMFRGYACSTSPILTNWDVYSATNMKGMFSFSQTINPNISAWDVSNVVNMSKMFYNNTAANPVIDNWDISSLKDISYMFANADSVNPNLSAWNVSGIEIFDYCFSETALANPRVSAWNMASAKSIDGMFYSANTANPIVSNWNVSNVKSMRQTFSYMANGSNVVVNDWDVSSCEAFDGMFEFSPQINPVITNWNLTAIVNEHASGRKSPTNGLNNMFTQSGITSANILNAINVFELYYRYNSSYVQNIVVGSLPTSESTITGTNYNNLKGSGWVFTF